MNSYPRFTRFALATFPLSAIFALSISAVVRAGAGAEPHIATVSISPAAVVAGQSATLIVELSDAAPAGGFEVRISHLTQKGMTDAVVNMPQVLRFDEGTRRLPFEIRTQRVTDGPTDILLTAFHGAEHQRLGLTIR